MKLTDTSILLQLTGDALLAAGAVFAAHSLRFGGLPGDGVSGATPGQLPLFVFAVIFSSFLLEVYTAERTSAAREQALRIALVLPVAFVLLSVLYYVLPALKIGRGFLLLALAFFGVLQFLWHRLISTVTSAPGMARRVLVLGTGLVAKKIGALIRSRNHQHVLRGYFSCDREDSAVPPHEIVGDGTPLAEVVRQERPQKIVVSLTERRGTMPVRDILSCKLNGVEVIEATSFYEELTGKLLLEDLHPSGLIFNDGFRVTRTIRISKRAFDITAALAGLLLSAPLLPLIALVVAADSRGPVFFRQMRTGENEEPFELYKFRTMRQDAEQASGAVWSQKNDQRITRAGRFLRKSRLDELPQLWNVLRGDMSLIGPRPERPEFVEKLKELIPYYSERHVVKPGITGWAQIKYPYGASVEDALEKLRFDLFYIKNLSPLLDFLIVLETIKVMLFGRGGR